MMDKIMKKAEKLPLIAIFTLLYILVDKIISPLFSIIFMHYNVKVLLPTFTGFLITVSLIALAVLQILKKCNIAVPVLTGVILLTQIIAFLSNFINFFKSVFGGINAMNIITNLLNGLSLILLILALVVVLLVALYATGILKKLPKAKLISILPMALILISFVIGIITNILSLIFYFKYVGAPLLFNSLLCAWPASLWFSLALIAVTIWVMAVGHNINAPVEQEIVVENQEY